MGIVDERINQFERMGGPEVCADFFCEPLGPIEHAATDDDLGVWTGPDLVEGVDEYADFGEIAWF